MLFPCGPGRCVVGSVVRNAPQPLPVSFADRDGERFSCLFTVWIVTLRAELNKSFLCSPRLRNCGTVNKRYQRPEGRVEVGDCGLAGAQQLENSSWVLHRSRTGIFDRKILQRQADLVSSVLLHVVDFQDIIISPGYLSRLSAQQLENI